MQQQLAEMENKEGISILSPFSLRLFKYPNEVGLPLLLEDYKPPEVTTSPDGESVAWIPRKSALPSALRGIRTIFLKSSRHAVQSVRFDGQFGEQLAISSVEPKLLALCVIGETGGQQVSIINSKTGTSVTGISQPEKLTGGSQIERLSICRDGSRLVIGSRSAFALIETNSGRVIGKQQGRFPALSPDGRQVAYVNLSQQLRTVDVNNLNRISGGEAISSTYGVGAWSPNGRFLLAGIMKGVFTTLSLIAVNTTNGEFTVLRKLPEGDFGSRFLWISDKLA